MTQLGRSTGRTSERLRPTHAAFSGPSRLAYVSQPARESVVATVVAIGAALVVAMWWHDTSSATVRGAGGWLTAGGRVTGLVGTYLIVVEVLLMARVTWIDRMIGMDRLALWHRRNGEYSVTLLVAHAVLTIWGYAVSAHSGLVKETTSVVLSYTDMLAATVGLGLLVVVAVISARAVRRRVEYQTWYFIHLYTYIALALSFAHQFATGIDFATHPWNRYVWVALYCAVGGLLLAYRVGLPVRGAVRHRLRVERVADEASGVISVYLSGLHLSEMNAQAGQFCLWRFLTKDRWWQTHPYSLSAAPNGRWLRLTVKATGDHSSELRSLPVGTRVVSEGPYGAFSEHRRTKPKVLLIGGGVGIAPLRALFESLAGGPGDIALIYRANNEGEVAFKGELDAIAHARRAQVHYAIGSRAEHPEYLTAAHLEGVVPDLVERDIFICGPPGMTAAVEATVRSLGVRRRHIHSENFEL